MGSGIGGALSNLMSYPALIISILLLVVSVFFLIAKRTSIKKEVKILFIILAAIAAVVVLFLVITAFMFDSGHPIAPPVPYENGSQTQELEQLADDKADADYHNIRFYTTGAEKAGLSFAREVYSVYLTNLPEGNGFLVTDYEMTDYLLLESADNSVSAEFSFAVKPVDAAYYAGLNTDKGTGEYEGWLILRKSFAL